MPGSSRFLNQAALNYSPPAGDPRYQEVGRDTTPRSLASQFSPRNRAKSLPADMHIYVSLMAGAPLVI